MRTQFLLLKIIAKAALHTSGVGGIWAIVMEDVPELANNVWTEWKAARNDVERKADAEAIAGLEADATPDIKRIVDEVAADQPESVRQDLTAYLAQVPGSVRQVLRRPDDPAGRTMSRALEPRSAEDLIPLLAARRPRFKPGDQPIAGTDWVLVELLGIGGFGEVWKARNSRTHDVAALKFCTEPEARKSLERELKLLIHLGVRLKAEGAHPGIVRLEETYLNADPPCLRYEYVEGGTLAGVIKEWARREPRPSPVEVTRHLLAIAKIVAFVHGLKPAIVHRDLKPANILVRGTNDAPQFKVTDFGIGEVVSDGLVRAKGRPGDPSLLLTKAAIGSHSPIYASPEQAAGGDAHPRDDVHALGVIWYQMLTGNLTVGPTGGDAWRKKLAVQGMSPALIQILVACLEEANDRIPNAGVLCQRIEQALPARKVRSPIRALMACALVGVLAVGFAIIYAAWNAEYPDDARDAIPPKRSEVPPPSPKVASAPSEIAKTETPPEPLPSPDVPDRPVTSSPPAGNEPSLTNTLGMTLALIPAGEFEMGSDDSGQSDEKPKHQVKITRPFYLGTTEVTVGQFRRFVDATGYKTDAERIGNGYGWDAAKSTYQKDPQYTWRSPGFPQGDDHPVVLVSHNDGLALCEWLKQQEGATYRLSTEAEWEYACRAGGKGVYGSGDDEAELDRVAWYGAKLGIGTHPVGQKQGNAFGLYDMLGNAHEWCGDWHGSDYYAKSSATDPAGPADGSGRVIRGGGWDGSARGCRAAYRSRDWSMVSSYDLGLRLARVPSGP